VGFEPTEMLSVRKDDLDNGDVVRQLRFENKLRQYLAKIDGQGVSLRRSSFCAVKNFFESYDMPLKMRRRDWPRGEHLKVVRPVTKGEMRSLLAVSDLLHVTHLDGIVVDTLTF